MNEQDVREFNTLPINEFIEAMVEMKRLNELINELNLKLDGGCLLYTSPSPRDRG